jgi:dTDP-4-dehydrorhamnose reductase
LRIVVSGAAGFIGSHFCDRLLAEGHTVVGLDNFLTGAARNLGHLAAEPRFGLIQQDITEPFSIAGAVDAVVNMASPASPKDYHEHPIETLMVGSAGTRRMLELALEKGARFLLTSTSECYGDPEVHPQVESYWGHVNPVGPRSCYDESKRFAEALTMAYHRKHGLATNIARIFNTYGPRMKLNDGRVVPAFLGEALAGSPITVFGRWLADPQFLLRKRPGGWPLPADALRRALPGESGQPARNDDPRIRRAHSAADWFRIAYRVPAAARRRPQTASPRHRQGARYARLGAASDPRRGFAVDGGVFSAR